MHPDPAFRLDDAACRDVAHAAAFAHVFVHGSRGAGVIHAPCTLDEAGDLRFHCSARNRVAPLLPGARAIASFSPVDGYVSPDWYDTAGQVPTWNYVAVEAEGQIERLSRDALIAQVDALGDEHEARLAPKPQWTRDKLPVAAFERMVAAIEGYVIRVEAWRGTAKLSQNKPTVDRAGVADALDASGRDDLASAVRTAR
ncbi:FMN-binding negative transcriptional regulator [Sphingomonas sp.]|uniref:FMN-binding negative transcriptional regulator n=1 Tax=Sphingomonas sp. TaxID=28214 RepID=UPI0035C86155